MRSIHKNALYAAKNYSRRLRFAGRRHSRNTLLSAITAIDMESPDTSNNHNERADLENVNLSDITMHDKEGQSIISKNQDERHDDNTLKYTPDIGNDGSEDDRMSPDLISNLLHHDSHTSSPDTKQVSVALALFRHRHQLSKSCMNDLCDLLRCLGVQNVPSDFRSIQRHVVQTEDKVLQSKKYIVCPQCSEKGTNSSKCENTKCSLNFVSNKIPTTLFTFKLLPQIISIIERQKLMVEPNDDDKSLMCDIQDSSMRRSIVDRERVDDPSKQIITLLLNSDGVMIKKISRSIWVTCMVINELPRDIRFNMKNVIISSISIGSMKPKKNQFQSFIYDWVYELRQLERGFYVSYPNTNNRFVKVCCYLVAATLDKPAQSLLMNINDPVGYYSCGRCTIRGVSERSGHGSIRVFLKYSQNDIQQRSNQLYDEHIRILSRRRSKPKSNEIDLACGQQGPCILRDLTYFEIGRSFPSDSLHNIYAGTFKRLLELWFKTCRQPYSIQKSVNLIELKLNALRYPSTTYHLPSPLRFYQTYKGNEFRMTLLFGYQYFQPFLPAKFYEHFRLLAYAMNLAESSVLHHDAIEIISALLDEFDRLFPLIYPRKSVTSVIHSVTHVPETLRDFGPIQNYSTFNFESTVGSIVQTINGPNLVIAELIDNLNILQGATAELENTRFNRSLGLFIKRIFSSKRNTFPNDTSIHEQTVRVGRTVPLPDDHFVMEHLHNEGIFDFTFHRTCWKKNVRFSVYESTSTSKSCDSCVQFKKENDTKCGFIVGIIYDSKQKCSVIIHCVRVAKQDSFIFKGKTIVNPYVFFGQLSNPPHLEIINLHDIIIKLAYSKQETFHFFQFPNTSEST
ncbi:unnamed protein product [Adineta ricciae]|uniref:Transposase domain-containing protein n=1 Tax=Adineta ricciae TaxID=249248 RepID=A0A815E8Y0_ADIRI|nr:unnamed protein product [Adineta ricciae]CAF1311713.1 unnamed protein product [Adineta ricciae]